MNMYLVYVQDWINNPILSSLDVIGNVANKNIGLDICSNDDKLDEPASTGYFIN